MNGDGGREGAVQVPVPREAMRYNEKELQALSRQPAEMAAELGMRGPKKGSGERDPGDRDSARGGRLGPRSGRGCRRPDSGSGRRVREAGVRAGAACAPERALCPQC